jgi:hypothetical protein
MSPTLKHHGLGPVCFTRRISLYFVKNIKNLRRLFLLISPFVTVLAALPRLFKLAVWLSKHLFG